MNVRINEWIKGTIITEEENLNLPVPRLEIRYFNINEVVTVNIGQGSGSDDCKLLLYIAMIPTYRPSDREY